MIYTFGLPLAWAKRSATAVFVVEFELVPDEDRWTGREFMRTSILSVKVPPGIGDIQKKIGIAALRVLEEKVAERYAAEARSRAALAIDMEEE